MRIVGAFACSHAGLIVSHADKADKGKKDRIYAGFDAIRREIEALQPDAIFIVGTDHGRIYTYANLPVFVMGVGPVAHGIGDAGLGECDVPVHQPLAQATLTGAINRGVDMAYSEDTRIDHSFVTPLSLITPAYDVPIVPVALNSNRPPLATVARVHAVGRRIADAFGDAPEGRVVVIGTGGLSHWVGDKARQAYVRWPAGTRMGHEAEYPVVIGERGEINEDWDRGFLELLGRSGAQEFINHSSQDQVFAEAGNGAQEIRNWLIIAGMVDDAPLETIAYEAIPEWHTGIGVARFRLD